MQCGMSIVLSMLSKQERGISGNTFTIDREHKSVLCRCHPWTPHVGAQGSKKSLWALAEYPAMA